MKGVTEISGLRSIRSMHSAGKRSIPRVQSSAYLDLYVLKKEKERLEKEDYILDKRRKDIQNKLKGINKQMDKLMESDPGPKGGRKKNVHQEDEEQAQKKLKKMSLNY